MSNLTTTLGRTCKFQNLNLLLKIFLRLFCVDNSYARKRKLRYIQRKNKKNLPDTAASCKVVETSVGVGTMVGACCTVSEELLMLMGPE